MIDAGCHCAACAAAAAGHAPWHAALKALSLGYLLSLPGLGLAALGWRYARPRLAPQQRAGAGFAALACAFALQAALGVAVWYGVVSQRIVMSTDYFHALMHAGWSSVITAAGLTVLGVSLLVALWSWRRAQPPRRIALAAWPAGWDAGGAWTAEAQAHGLRLYPASGVATAALTGVLSPALLVNPAYWARLDGEQRALALGHEQEHLRRRDNLRKLVLEGVALLYGVLPGVRQWAADYELDSELAVDDACRRRDEAAYRTLVAEAAAFALSAAGAPDVRPRAREAARRPFAKGAPALRSVSHLAPGDDAPRSGLSHSDLALRLTALAAPRRAGQAGRPLLAALGLALLSALPTLAVLSHPALRCLLACYLGY